MVLSTVFLARRIRDPLGNALRMLLALWTAASSNAVVVEVLEAVVAVPHRRKEGLQHRVNLVRQGR